MTACISETIGEFKKYDFSLRLAAVLAASLFLPYFLCGLFILFVFIYSVCKPKIRRKILSLPGAKFLMLVPALSLLSAAYAKNAVGLLGAAAVALIFWCGLYLRCVMTERLYEFILKIICALSVVSFIVAAAQMIIIRSGNTQLYKSFYFVFDPEYFNGLMSAYNVYRSVSTFFNANYFAAAASLVALICIYKLLSQSRGKYGKIFYSAVFAVNIGSMLLAGSRTAFIAFFAGAAALLLFMKKYRLLLAALALIFAVVIILLVFPNAALRFDSLQSTVIKRLGIWQNAVTLLKNPFCALFGEGMYTYMFHSAKNPEFVYAVHSHNMLLEFLVCFGVTGTGLIAAYVVKCKKTARRAMLTSGKKYAGAALAAAAGCLVLISGLTDVIITGVETGTMILFLFSSVGIYEKAIGDENV